jgi:hypothetical protein
MSKVAHRPASEESVSLRRCVFADLVVRPSIRRRHFNFQLNCTADVRQAIRELNEIGVDAAWEAADRYGPGWAWRELGADQGAKARPGHAADLYRPQLESDLRYPDTKLYPHIAVTLATMSKLYERGGRADEFVSLIAQIRQDYGWRPSLMKALSAKGL